MLKRVLDCLTPSRGTWRVFALFSVVALSRGINWWWAELFCFWLLVAGAKKGWKDD